MMNITQLETRLAQLEYGLSQANRILRNPVDGRLEIVTKKNQYQYYKVLPSSTGSDPKRIYLRTSQREELAAIANRDYAKHLYNLAIPEIRLLRKLLSLYQKPTAFDCHQNLHPGRKPFTHPILLSDAEYAELWQRQRDPHINPYPLTSQIFTENNEQVRSKTEKIIADKLYMEGIPYKYEEALQLGDKKFFPDFTILVKQTRKIYYWEHFGLLDQPDYQNEMLNKLEIYSRHQIISGQNLIVTFENKSRPISVKQIEQIIMQNFVACTRSFD